MKAVLWTDVFQALLMYLGIFAVLIKGIIDLGGVSNVYRIANEGGRLTIPGFEVDPEVRYTVWNLLMQGIILSMSAFGGNQVQIQRLLTVKNLSRSRTALYVSIPMGVSFHLLNCLAGIVIYANFYNCDPMTSPNKPISSADQLMPYYIMSALGQYPGLPGVCICGIFSASLSTVSSAVNSLAAVTMEDLVRPFFVARGYSQKKMAFSAKAITLFYGFLCVLLTFLVATFGNLVQASLTVFGMLGGPVLAIFLLGMLTERCNEKGVIIGLVSSIAIAAWVSFGASAAAPPPQVLPVSTEGCFFPNSSVPQTSFLLNVTSPLAIVQNSAAPITNSTEPSVTETSYEDIFPLYRISYMWFAPIGFFSAVIIGYVASIIINLINGETKEVPKEFLSPALKFFLSKPPKTSEKKDIQISGPMELQSQNSSVTVLKSKENERF